MIRLPIILSWVVETVVSFFFTYLKCTRQETNKKHVKNLRGKHKHSKEWNDQTENVGADIGV